MTSAYISMWSELWYSPKFNLYYPIIDPITRGGVLEFGFGGGVRLTTQNPYPFLGVILAENGTRF